MKEPVHLRKKNLQKGFINIIGLSALDAMCHNLEKKKKKLPMPRNIKTKLKLPLDLERYCSLTIDLKRYRWTLRTFC